MHNPRHSKHTSMSCPTPLMVVLLCVLSLANMPCAGTSADCMASVSGLLRSRVTAGGTMAAGRGIQGARARQQQGSSRRHRVGCWAKPRAKRGGSSCGAAVAGCKCCFKYASSWRNRYNKQRSAPRSTTSSAALSFHYISSKPALRPHNQHKHPCTHL
jgi:hypothetical protein